MPDTLPLPRPLPLSNDHAGLTPRTTFDTPKLVFDFPALRIGVAEYAEGPTGCTVFHFPQLAQAAVDVRGGSHGTLLTEERDRVGAICLAGGSLLGIEAATGVTAELFAQRDYSTGWGDIPLVSAGIIFDYGPRGNSIYPDKALGRAALRAAESGVFPLGACGAGASATVGKGLGFEMRESGGQGGSFRQVGPTKVAVFTVVNAVGAIVDRQGKVVRGHRDPETGQRYHFMEGLEKKLSDAEPVEPPKEGNTTLTVLVTNQKLNLERGLTWSLRQLARTVHSSMSQAIQPFHTLYDGDVLWAVTTNEVENPTLNDVALGVLASEVAWDAVLSCFSE
ncbi:MAG TPA: P1 family peptidase [Chloroflexia bacterium]|jgi:L-aminopeptidase/D-esterase-like protein